MGLFSGYDHEYFDTLFWTTFIMACLLEFTLIARCSSCTALKTPILWSSVLYITLEANMSPGKNPSTGKQDRGIGTTTRASEYDVFH